MLPESLVPADKAQPNHSASGCNPRRPQPFGRAIEVFVASRMMMMRIIETLLLKGKLTYSFLQETRLPRNICPNSLSVEVRFRRMRLRPMERSRAFLARSWAASCSAAVVLSYAIDHPVTRNLAAPDPTASSTQVCIYGLLRLRGDCAHTVSSSSKEVNSGRNLRISGRILHDLPIDCVISSLSTTGGVVPVDSDRKRS